MAGDFSYILGVGIAPPPLSASLPFHSAFSGSFPPLFPPFPNTSLLLSLLSLTDPGAGGTPESLLLHSGQVLQGLSSAVNSGSNGGGSRTGKWEGRECATEDRGKKGVPRAAGVGEKHTCFRYFLKVLSAAPVTWFKLGG